MPKDTLQPGLMRCEPERGGVLEAKHGPDARRWRGKGQPVDHSRDGDQHGRNATLHDRANPAISWRWRAVEAARQATTSSTRCQANAPVSASVLAIACASGGCAPTSKAKRSTSFRSTKNHREKRPDRGVDRSSAGVAADQLWKSRIHMARV